MNSSDKSKYTPPLDEKRRRLLRKRMVTCSRSPPAKRSRTLTSPASRGRQLRSSQERRSHISRKEQSFTSSERRSRTFDDRRSRSMSRGRSRMRCNIRDRKALRKFRRNRSRTRKARSRRMGRSRSRSKLERQNRKRYRDRNDTTRSSYTECTNSEYSRSRSCSTFTNTSYNSFSSDSSRKSRSKSRKRYGSRRSKKTRGSTRSRRNKNNESVVNRFIEAINSHGRNTFVGAHDVIPKFDPSQKTQTTKAWLKKVNEIAAMYKWSSKQTIFHALPKLSGLARRWYYGLYSVNLTWKEWQRKILQNFPDDRNYADRLSEMLDRRSNRDETLEEYFYDKAKLVNHCNIRGKDAVDCIIHGIYDHNIRLNAQAANFKNPNKLLRYLRSITGKNVKELKKTGILPKAHTIPTKNADSIKNTRNPNVARIPRCFNCSEEGHTVPKCPKELQRCTKCSRLGHIAEHCRREQNPRNPLNTTDALGAANKVQRIESSEVKTDIYNKIIKVNDVTKTAIVDFGSQCSLIKKIVLLSSWV